MKAENREEAFWRPDNSAVFTASAATREGPFIFRLSCELKETVDADALERALERSARRFPYLFVVLRRGLFWHYFESAPEAPKPEREGTVPCALRGDDRVKPLCRVFARGRTVACEFHHAVTDGTGGMVFLKTLIIEYLLALGVPLESGGIRHVDFIDRTAEPESDEWEDSYRRYFRRDLPPPEEGSKAWLLPGRRFRHAYRVTAAEMPLEKALTLARERKASLTEWLVACYAAALQDIALEEKGGKKFRSKALISIQVPVNLRKLYPSRTMRNFFLFAAPSIDLRFGPWEFPDILERVHHQMRLGVTKMEFYRQLKRNVGGELHPLGRGVVLPVKNLALKLMNRRLNLSLYSGSLSNLQAIALPEDAAARVERFLFFPPSNRVTGANVGVLSWKDRLIVTVGSTLEDPSAERFFFRRLAREGLEVRVDTNLDWAARR